MRLLVVDDQNVVREALARALEAIEGIELVVEVESAREAISELERHRFDVAVMEFGLPDRGGAELIRRLKAAGEVRVLVLSAARDEFSVGEAMRAGADGYISKR